MSNNDYTQKVKTILNTASKALHDISKRSPLVKLNTDKSVECKKLSEIKRQSINDILELEIANPSQIGTKNDTKNMPFAGILPHDDLDDHQQKILNTLINRAKVRSRAKNFQTLHLIFGMIQEEKLELYAPLLILRIRIKPNTNKQTYLIERHGSIEVNQALVRIMEENAIDSKLKEKLEDYLKSIKNIDKTSSYEQLRKHLQHLKDMLIKVLPNSIIDNECVWLENLTFSNDMIIRDIDTIRDSQDISLGSLEQLLDATPQPTHIQKENNWINKLNNWINKPIGPFRTSNTPSIDVMTRYLVMSTDRSQREVIEDVLSGKSICVQGPPGTGKSQTIANMIAVLIANNKRVLFVAEKDAAIDAVTKHLNDLKDFYLEVTDNPKESAFSKDTKNRPLPSIPKTDAEEIFKEWKEYLRTAKNSSRDLQNCKITTVDGKQQKLIDYMNSVFTPENTDNTLYWETHMKPLINTFSVRTFGIWGFWHIWGYWYARLFLKSLMDMTVNRLKNVPTSSQPEALIRSLPIGLRGIVRHLKNIDTPNIDDIVRYHLQRLFIRKQLPQRTLEKLQGQLKNLPAWANDYYENGKPKPNQYAISMVIDAYKRNILSTKDKDTNSHKSQTDTQKSVQSVQIDRSKYQIPCVITTPTLLRGLFADLHAQKFDVVIIDEASQMRPEAAIGAFFRAKQYVVFGDENQLPPTSFGMAYTNEDVDDSEMNIYNEFKGQTGESVLSWAYEKNVFTHKKNVFTQLEFFYRGSEQLISASNTFFYKDRIKSFPQTSDKSVTHHYIQPELDKSSTDDNIFERVGELFKNAKEKNQNVLIIASGKEPGKKLSTRMKFDKSYEIENILTTIEEVQGNEADCVIFFFDHPEIRGDGNINLQKLGPINNKGGERRLNVAFTRAKKEMHIVTSFGAHQIDTSSDKVAHKFLKRFLEVADQNNRQTYTPAYKVMAWEQHFAKLANKKLPPSLAIQHSYGQSQQPITWVKNTKAYETDLGRFAQHTFDIRDELIRRQMLQNFGWGKIDIIDVSQCLDDFDAVLRQIQSSAKQ